jgi:hypothetical protein
MLLECRQCRWAALLQVCARGEHVVSVSEARLNTVRLFSVRLSILRFRRGTTLSQSTVPISSPSFPTEFYDRYRSPRPPSRRGEGNRDEACLLRHFLLSFPIGICTVTFPTNTHTKSTKMPCLSYAPIATERERGEEREGTNIIAWQQTKQTNKQTNKQTIFFSFPLHSLDLCHLHTHIRSLSAFD